MKPIITDKPTHPHPSLVPFFVGITKVPIKSRVSCILSFSWKSDCLTSHLLGFDLTMVSGSCSEESLEQTAKPHGFASHAMESCHWYASKRGNSSLCTRAIEKKTSRHTLPNTGKQGKEQWLHQNQKMRLLNCLDVPTMVDWQQEINAITRSGKKYTLEVSHPICCLQAFPMDACSGSVHSNLIPYLNPTGNGYRAGNYYTLLICNWIKKCFPCTGKFICLFTSLLELHP